MPSSSFAHAKQFLICVVVPAALTLGGCGHVTPAGPEQHESAAIELDKAERVRVELKMPAGELDVQSGTQKLVDADFTYNAASRKPDVRYRSSGTVGDLVIEQPGTGGSTGNGKNRWNVRLNEGIPLDFRVEFGAGEAELQLGRLSLRTVDVQMGAGTLRLDLRGAPAKDYSVRIRGGVGEATIHLPRAAGISATVEGGLGEISTTGLRKSGDRYVNDAWETAAVRIRLDIKGGVGSIKLIAE